MRTGRAARASDGTQCCVPGAVEIRCSSCRKTRNCLWWSDRDGWDHLYLYDLKKGLCASLPRAPGR